MKLKFTILSATGIIGGFALVPFEPARAIDPPPDDAQPPAELRQESAPAPTTEKESEKEPLPFVGVATATLPDMVADHLHIESGRGVIVRTVVPGSPAEKAGLSVNDIILTIDGTEIGNPEAVTSAIRNHKIGDRLALELIHKGKPARMEITLGERPPDLAARLGQEPLLDGIPDDHADRLRGLIEQNLKAFGHGGEMVPDGNFDDTFRMLRERMGRGLGSAAGPGIGFPGNMRFEQSSTVHMMDDEGSIEIKTTDDHTEVTVRDSHNKTVWSGPWNSEEDKAAAPGRIRERIEKVHSGAGRGFTFRFGSGLRPKSDTIDN